MLEGDNMIRLFTDIDLDGLGCGVIAKLAFGDEAEVVYCSYRNLNQRVQTFLEDSSNNEKMLFITDLAVNDSVEKLLDNRYKEGLHVQVIDHHVTALHFNNYQWGQVIVEYENGKKTCATSLFYDHLIEKKLIERNPALEEFIELIRQYDTWEWDENENITAKRLNDLFFMFNRDQFEEDMIRRIKEHPNSFQLTDMENLLLDIEDNKIERYIQSKNRQIVQTYIDEYCVGIVHAEQYLSELGNALNKRNPHLDMIILVNVGSKKLGFRTIHDDVNVAEFAKRFGGGGHPKAAGSDLTEEAFKQLVIDVYHLPPIKPDPENNIYNVKNSKHGTAYQNRSGKVSFIRPVSDHSYEIIHDGQKLDQMFNSFDEAERYIKRNYGSYLRYDDDFLQSLSNSIPLSKEELEEKFHDMIDRIKNL